MQKLKSPIIVVIGILLLMGTMAGIAFTDVLIQYGTTNWKPPVSEPVTMLLLGSGLIGLAIYGRKKFFKSSRKK